MHKAAWAMFHYTCEWRSCTCESQQSARQGWRIRRYIGGLETQIADCATVLQGCGISEQRKQKHKRNISARA